MKKHIINILAVLTCFTTIIGNTHAMSSWSPTLLVNTEAFQVLDNGDGTDNIELQFGDSVSAKLTYNINSNEFVFSHNVQVAGSISATGSITVSGALIVSGATVLNSSGNNNDTQIQGDSEPNLFFLDASTDRIGIGTATPDATVEILGALSGFTVYASTISGSTMHAVQQLSSSGTLTTEGITTINSADPTLIFAPELSGDTAFWIGVQDDSDGNDDDRLQIGTGTIVGSNAVVTISRSGSVGIGSNDPEATLEVAGTISGTTLNLTGTASVFDLTCADCINQAEVGSGAIGTNELKTAVASVNGTGNANVTMNDFSFFPNAERDDCDDAAGNIQSNRTNAADDTVGRFRMQAFTCTSGSWDVRWRYVTSSDRPTIWVIANSNGDITTAWQAEDPIVYPTNPNPLDGSELESSESFSSPEPLTVTELQTLYSTLPAGDSNTILQNLGQYLGKRGWTSSFSAITDISSIDPRYEPAARLWAMRFVAQFYGIDTAELIIETMRMSGSTLAPQSNYYTVLSNHLAARSASLVNIANDVAFIESLRIETQSADLAEIYITKESNVRLGDVVRIADLGPGFVTRANTNYDQRAFGVVSTDPALVIGEELANMGETTLEIALAGRVPVTVSTTNGSIGTGDYLTSSTQTGIAMKATANGHIIGQALEAYSDAGTGSVLMFVKPAFYKVATTGGSANIEQHTGAIVADGTQVFTHTSDPNYTRVIDVYYQDAETADVTNFDVLDAQSGSWIREMPTLTEISGNAARLTPTGGYTPTTNNISLGATAIASHNPQNPANGNDNTTSIWYNAAGVGASERWWGVQLSAGTTIVSGEIEWFSTTYTADFRVQGSNNGTTWTTLGTFTHNSASPVTQAWTLATAATYSYYRYDFFNFSNASYTVLREGRFFEATGAGFSTTPSYVRNDTGLRINTSNWSSINTTSGSVVEPANTTLRYLFSFDGGTTWKEFSSGTWNTRTLTNIENDGMTTNQLNGLTNANWFTTGGINSTALNTLDIAVSLVTTDTSQTPVFDSLTFNISTQQYWEKGDDSSVQVRLLSPTQTSVKNLLQNQKDFRINIAVP